MILVFDIGTTTVKAALFTIEGKLVGRGELPATLSASSNPLVHEADPLEWIRAIQSLSGNLLREHRGDLKAVTVSGNGPTLIPVDSGGMPVYPAMTWMDRRGTEETALIKDLCGIDIDPTFYLPKALWIRRNQAEVYEKTAYFLSCPEYISYFLTGEASMILPGTGLENYIWTEDLLDKLDMDKSKFPALINPGDLVGTVTSKAASLTGIREGVSVFAGGADFIVSLLGTATVRPGRACDRAGTSEGINICSDKEVRDKRILCYRHIVSDYWNVTGIISTSGKALDWFKNNIYKQDGSFDSLFGRISKIRPGAGKLLFLPYLTGERAPVWDPDARGVFAGLTVSHGRDDMARAVLESTGYAMRDVLSVIEENGVEADELRITGRPSKSALWNQIKADITGKNILVPELNESELTGDLCVALYGIGEYSSPGEASEDIVKIDKIFEPDISRKKLYDELFIQYREIYRKLRTVFADMADIKEEGI